jgi:hypothetical protein
MRDLHWTFNGPGRQWMYTHYKTWFQYPPCVLSAPRRDERPLGTLLYNARGNCQVEIYAWSENRPPPIDLLLLLRRERLSDCAPAVFYACGEMYLKQVFTRTKRFVLYKRRWKGAHQSVLSKGEAGLPCGTARCVCENSYQHPMRKGGCKIFKHKSTLEPCSFVAI